MRTTDLEDDELSLTVSHSVYDENNDEGRVVFNFSKSVKWLALSPDKAMRLANAIIEHATQVKQ